jgi:hypothetical protein
MEILVDLAGHFGSDIFVALDKIIFRFKLGHYQPEAVLAFRAAPIHAMIHFRLRVTGRLI